MASCNDRIFAELREALLAVDTQEMPARLEVAVQYRASGHVAQNRRGIVRCLTLRNCLEQGCGNQMARLQCSRLVAQCALTLHHTFPIWPLYCVSAGMGQRETGEPCTISASY